MFGTINTEDGSEIGFEIFGHFRPSKADKEVWEQLSAIRFATTDERYEWLLPILGRDDRDVRSQDLRASLSGLRSTRQMIRVRAP